MVGVTLAWLTCSCIRASLDASICWCVTGFVTILEAFSDSRFDRRQMGLSIRVSSRGLATGSCSPASLQGIMALGAIFLPREFVSCCVVGVSRNSPQSSHSAWTASVAEAEGTDVTSHSNFSGHSCSYTGGDRRQYAPVIEARAQWNVEMKARSGV